MKKNIKKIAALGLVIGVSVISNTCVFAAQEMTQASDGSWRTLPGAGIETWVQDELGWYRKFEITTIPPIISVVDYVGWHWIDGNYDGVGECYYFGENHYILTDTVTPDGYTVNADGAWVENGVVQTVGKASTLSTDTEKSKYDISNYQTYYDEEEGRWVSAYEQQAKDMINDPEIWAQLEALY